MVTKSNRSLDNIPLFMCLLLIIVVISSSNMQGPAKCAIPESTFGYYFSHHTTPILILNTSAANHLASMKISIGIVKPTFTGAAYNNAFYSWYNLAVADVKKNNLVPRRCYQSSPLYYTNPCEIMAPVRDPTITHFLTGKIPQSTDAYNLTTPTGIETIRTWGAYNVLSILPNLKQMLTNSTIRVITDGDINDAPTAAALNKAYSILILGHQEYVTQKEYDNLKDFVANGGILICLDGNIFYAEVTYNEPAQTVTFVKGHRFSFDGKLGWLGDLYERWRNQTSDWLGSNFYISPFVLVPSLHEFQAIDLTFTYNPFGYARHEEQYVSNPHVKILMNYGAHDLLPSGGVTKGVAPGEGFPHPLIATYENSYGRGRVIEFGIYADELLDNSSFLNFFDNMLLESLSSSSRG